MNDKTSEEHAIYISLPKALLWILLSTLLISGSCALVLFYYLHFLNKQKGDPSFTIVAVVQTTSGREGLKTSYLAELMELSINHPKNLYTFNAFEARQKILSSPLIKGATVRKIKPGAIHVDYILRYPIAFLADFTNTAIDKEGVAFPFKPFFTPKNLPEIYLGNVKEQLTLEGKALWGSKLQSERLDMAFALLNLAKRHCCDAGSSLSRIDLSQAFALSSGRRQIVMIFQEKLLKETEQIYLIRSYILRLTPTQYRQELSNYLVLRSHLRKHTQLWHTDSIKSIIIDLRLPNLAFLEGV